jgi:tetratricopeptide (TPR) repeat protein
MSALDRAAAAVASCVLSLLLAVSLCAQDQVVTLKGEVIAGKIISDDGHVIQIKTESQVVKLGYGKLSVETIYHLRSGRAKPDNGFSQLELANWCRDHGLFDDARQHYQMAVDAKPDLEGMVKEQMGLLRVYAVRHLMTEARKLNDKGEFTEAEKVLAQVVKEFPHEHESDAARVMLEQIARNPKAKGSPVILNAQIMGLETHRQYEKASHHLDAATHMNQKGLAATKYQDQALHFFHEAIGQAKRGLNEAKRIDKKAVARSEVADEIAKLEQDLTEQIVQGHLHSADMWLTAGSFNKALQEANAVLAIDPQNAEAKGFAGRIAEAKADGGTWGWGYGRGRWAGHRPAARRGRGRR